MHYQPIETLHVMVQYKAHHQYYHPPPPLSLPMSPPLSPHFLNYSTDPANPPTPFS